MATAVFARAAASHTGSTASSGSEAPQAGIQSFDDDGFDQDDDFFAGPSQAPSQGFGAPSATSGGS